MKNVSFLFIFLTFLQIASGAQAQNGQRPSIEQAVDKAGQEIATELEKLARELGVSADGFSRSLEQWLDSHTDELENWSDKYSHQWEAWSRELETKLGRFANDQEEIWQRWARDYESNFERWARELESEELTAKRASDLINRNLKALSKMPLGQMVDKALQKGVGELGDAPWESLDELGSIAESALAKPLAELNKTLEPDSPHRQAIERSANELQRSLLQLRDDLESGIFEQSDSVEENLENRRGLPNGDSIRKKIQREQERHRRAMETLLKDLKNSGQTQAQSLEADARATDHRHAKRTDGKNLNATDSGAAKPQHRRHSSANRSGREHRHSSNRGKSLNQKKLATKGVSDELETLRTELNRLRSEIESLKRKAKK